MCDICFNNPCLPYCPNSKNMVSIGNCTECGKDFYPGYYIYTDKYGHEFCSEHCILNYYQVNGAYMGEE